MPFDYDFTFFLKIFIYNKVWTSKMVYEDFKDMHYKYMFVRNFNFY